MGTMKIDKNEEAMKSALAEHGPLQVIIDALSLAFYSSGIISGSACEHATVNHAVSTSIDSFYKNLQIFFTKNYRSYWLLLRQAVVKVTGV